MLVIGDREAAAGTVAVRHRGRGDLGAVELDRFTEEIVKEIKNREMTPAC